LARRAMAVRQMLVSLCLDESIVLITTTAAISALSSFAHGVCSRTSGWAGPGLDLTHMYVANRTIILSRCPHLRSLHIPSWDSWTGSVSIKKRSRRFHGRVSSQLGASEKSFSLPVTSGFSSFYPYSVFVNGLFVSRHSLSSRRRSWYRPFHPVICLPSFSRFSTGLIRLQFHSLYALVCIMSSRQLIHLVAPGGLGVIVAIPALSRPRRAPADHYLATSLATVTAKSCEILRRGSASCWRVKPPTRAQQCKR